MYDGGGVLGTPEYSTSVMLSGGGTFEFNIDDSCIHRFSANVCIPLTLHTIIGC